jgi:uncharacterized RDD family membrane protein YckC
MFCPKCRTEYRKGFYTCAACEISLVDKLPPEPPPKPVKQRVKVGWKCPECGMLNNDDISKCECGYDSNRPLKIDSHKVEDLEKQNSREILTKKYKTFWPRFWAGGIDSIVFIPLMVIDHFVWKAHSSIPILLIAIWHIAYSLSFSIYSILMHGKYGQTLGKMVMRVKVLDISENKLTMYQAIKRDIVLITMTTLGVTHNIPRIMSGVNIYDPAAIKFDFSFFILMNATMLWFLAEIVTMLFNNKRRAVHDFIARSVVIRLPQKNKRIKRNHAGNL